MVANLKKVLQNTESNKSFLFHKQLNYNITAILQIWVNTYVNPAELGTIVRAESCANLVVGRN